MSTDPASLPWRTGRHFARHVYAQLGEEPSDADPYVGTLETAELAALACVAHNDLLIRGELEARVRRQAPGARERTETEDLHWLIAAAHDIQIGAHDPGGGPALYVRLLGDETADLAAFWGCDSLGEGLAKAREWSEREGITP